MAVLSFPFNVFLAALLSAFATTFATLPLWRLWCLRIGLVDDPGHRKIHEAPIPLAGGLAVLSGNTRALTEQLLKLAANPSLRESLGRRGQEFVRANFSAERMVDELHALYLRLARARADPSDRSDASDGHSANQQH